MPLHFMNEDTCFSFLLWIAMFGKEKGIPLPNEVSLHVYSIFNFDVQKCFYRNWQNKYHLSLKLSNKLCNGRMAEIILLLSFFQVKILD